MRKSILALAFLCPAIVSSAALAEKPNWAGLYIGAHVGGATGEWDGRTTFTDPVAGVLPGLWANPNQSIDADGWVAGGQIGYNLQRDAFVFGIEADVSWSDLNGEGTFSTLGVDDRYNWKIKTELDAFGTVRGRLGFLVSPSLLLYGTGGFAWARTSGDLTVSHTWVPDPAASFGVTARGSARETHIGWTAGAGAELMLAKNWTVKAEWLHVDLGSEDYHLKGTSVPGGSPHETDSFPADLEFEVFRVGVNYLLN